MLPKSQACAQIPGLREREKNIYIYLPGESQASGDDSCCPEGKPGPGISDLCATKYIIGDGGSWP